jgi:predicted regulator of Ras-like GTPase activity (Roadblock/LC7/MglB family)
MTEERMVASSVGAKVVLVEGAKEGAKVGAKVDLVEGAKVVTKEGPVVAN